MKLDMSKITSNSEGHPVSNYLKWLKKETLITGIDFQRNYVWLPWRRTNLFLSIITGLTIPAIHAYRTEPGQPIKFLYDGKQRAITLQQIEDSTFVFDTSKFPFEPFIIAGKEYKKDFFNGKTFADMPEEIKDIFYDRNIKIEILTGVSEEIAEVLFSIMNMGQEALKPQEIRLATKGKKTRDFENSLKEAPLFVYASLSEKQRINNVQHDILDQITLLLQVGIADLSQSNVDGFINQYRSEGLPEDLKMRIKNVVGYLSEVIEILVTKKKESTQTQTKGRKADPNKPVKINYMNKLNIVSCAYLAEKAQNIMNPTRFADFVSEFFNSVPSAYKNAGGGKTADISSVRNRLNTITERFEEWSSKNSVITEQIDIS